MCVDPISLTAIGTTLFSALGSAGAAVGGSAAAAGGILGTGITATQALVGGSAIAGAVGAYASASGTAAVAKANANAAQAAGYSNEMLARNDARSKMATQLAVLSSRGESLSSGTPLALAADSARDAELNALQIRANAGNQAAGYRMQAQSAQMSMPYSIAGQLLNGGAELAKLGQL